MFQLFKQPFRQTDVFLRHLIPRKVFDLHCDTLSELRYAEKAGAPKSFAQNDLHIDLQKLKKTFKFSS